MGRVTENKQAKRNSIFHSSFDLFRTKGFFQTSISDIVTKAGVAKGTFYLYFKDKYDLRDKLIAYKAGTLFHAAELNLSETSIKDFSERLIFIADQIIDRLAMEPDFLKFISKNLSWGVFKTALLKGHDTGDTDFYNAYLRMVEESPYEFKNPEIMLFMIVELVGSSCYSCILDDEPLPMDEYKPYLYDVIRGIIQMQIVRKKNSNEIKDHKK